ncbi:hypothetical protein EON66_11305, partial [archaeon]
MCLAGVMVVSKQGITGKRDGCAKPAEGMRQADSSLCPQYAGCLHGVDLCASRAPRTQVGQPHASRRALLVLMAAACLALSAGETMRRHCRAVPMSAEEAERRKP